VLCADPDFVFLTHYAFVPRLGEQLASCYTVLRLDACEAAGASELGVGAPMVREPIEWANEILAPFRVPRRAKDCLPHQVREAMEWAEEYGVVEEESSPFDEIADDEIADPLRALAALLEAAFPDVSSPLCFGVSLAMVDPIPSVDACSPPLAAAAAAAAAAATATPVTSEATAEACLLDERAQLLLGALRTCARLCSLRDDGSGALPADQALQAARTVLRTGTLGAANDDAAARLVALSARMQVEALDAAEGRMQQAAADANGGRERRDKRAAACELLARAVRASERTILERLCAGDDVFGFRQ
jgi:hypothetical protein